MIIYDTQFNTNEWFLLIGLAIGIFTLWLLPKRFPGQVTNVFFLSGVFSGFFFDHTLSVQPVSYYDVNDSSLFEFMDFVSYWMYGIFSYLFFYVFDRLRVQPSRVPLYVLIWSLASLGFEWLGVQMGIYHYTNGYQIWYSLPIYLIVETLWCFLYARCRGTCMRSMSS
ncbi:hypothetical protein [Paenibacillus aestuarii]|uniref:Uncharacterized protein n=1 Tax=Paenibacillus aestuarii TaxID=516965 RepID=A0ABW0K7R2_9BACL|nr:hypothetical protein [Paenibacillus aestuarii]